MTTQPRTVQGVLADQFRITARISETTGEYHRLLQKVAASAFARQLTEDQPGPARIKAEQAEIAARQAAEACESQINDLEQQLSALGRELESLTRG